MALALTLAGCPSPPTDRPDAPDTSGDDTPAAPATFPPSPLDPWAASLLARARAALGSRGRVVALVVRADVSAGEGESLAWSRVGYVLGPFGLRVFERTARPIEGAQHGRPPGASEAAAAIARAVGAEVARLGAEDRAALPASAREALAGDALDVTELAIADVTRVEVASIGALAVGSDGASLVVDLTGDEPAVVTLSGEPPPAP